jgi:hypothetical protein
MSDRNSDSPNISNERNSFSARTAYVLVFAAAAGLIAAALTFTALPAFAKTTKTSKPAPTPAALTTAQVQAMITKALDSYVAGKVLGASVSLQGSVATTTAVQNPLPWSYYPPNPSTHEIKRMAKEKERLERLILRRRISTGLDDDQGGRRDDDRDDEQDRQLKRRKGK